MFRTAITTAAASLVALGTLAAMPAHAAEPATPVTKADLPSASVFTWYGKTAGFSTVHTQKGADSTAACQDKGLDEWTPNASFSRWFSNGTGYHYGAASIASFSSHKQAVAMQYAVAAQFDTCQQQLKDSGLKPTAPQTKRTVNLKGGGTAIIFTNHYRDTDGKQYMDARAVINTGTHVEVLSTTDWVGKTKHSDADMVTNANKAAVYLR